MVDKNKKIILSPSNQSELFKQYGLLQAIGNNEHFHEKLWILIKGIKDGTGEPILINSLGHNPCHAMLKQKMPYYDIENNLRDLEKKNLIEFPDPNSIQSLRTFVVTGDTAYQLNQMLFNFDLMKFLGEREECYRILKELGFEVSGSGVRDNLIQSGKKAWFWLNDENGIATSFLFKTFLWNNLSQAVKDASESIFN